MLLSVLSYLAGLKRPDVALLWERYRICHQALLHRRRRVAVEDVL